MHFLDVYVAANSSFAVEIKWNKKVYLPGIYHNSSLYLLRQQVQLWVHVGARPLESEGELLDVSP